MMRKILTLILFLNFWFLSVFSQNLEWAYKIGGTYSDYCYDVAKDNDGNIYLTGGFCNQVNFNPAGAPLYLNSTYADNSDIYVAKYDRNFNLIWVVKTGNDEWESGLAVEADGFKNVLVCGNYRGTVDFDPGASNYFLTSAQMSYFLAKYDSNGQFQWARDIGSDGNNYLTVPPLVNLYLDENSNIYTYIIGNDSLKKFDTNGNLVWKKFLTGMPVSDNRQFFYSVSGFNNPFIYHYFYQNAAVLIKTDANGNTVFSKTFAKSSDGFLGGYITYVYSGDLIIDGKFWGTVDFYGTDDTVTVSNYDSAMILPGQYGPVPREFIAKADTNGNVKWIKHYSGKSPEPYLITANARKEIFILGRVGVSVNFEPGGNLILFGGGTGHYIAKYDSSFNYLACAGFLGGSYNDFIGGFELYNDTAIIGGHFFNTADIDLTSGIYNLSTLPPEDIFVAKFSTFDISTNPAIIAECRKFRNEFLIYPNPCAGRFTLKGNSSRQQVRLQISNILGQKIKMQSFDTENCNVDMSACPSGIYFIDIIAGNESRTLKLIIDK